MYRDAGKDREDGRVAAFHWRVQCSSVGRETCDILTNHDL